MKVYSRFCDPLAAFPNNGRNLIFCLKIIIFNHFSVYFQQYKCLFISPIAFTITFRQILNFQKIVYIALTKLILFY